MPVETPEGLPVESDPAKNRRLSFELIKELGDELDTVLSREPTVPALELPEGGDEDVDLKELRETALAMMVIEEVPSAEYLKKHFDALVAYQNRFDALRAIDALEIPDSAAVWHVGDEDRSVVMTHETHEVLSHLEIAKRSVTRLVIVRPLAEGERGYEDATHVKLQYNVNREMDDPRGWTSISACRNFGTVYHGTFLSERPDLCGPMEKDGERLADCAPCGANPAYDIMCATEAEIRNARDLVRELVSAAA